MHLPLPTWSIAVFYVRGKSGGLKVTVSGRRQMGGQAFRMLVQYFLERWIRKRTRESNCEPLFHVIYLSLLITLQFENDVFGAQHLSGNSLGEKLPLPTVGTPSSQTAWPPER